MKRLISKSLYTTLAYCLVCIASAANGTANSQDFEASEFTADEEQSEPDSTEADTDFPASPQKNSSVTIQSGIGKEWLDSEGGVSRFNGSSNLGGLFAKGSSRITPDWKLEFWAAAHNFTVIKNSDTNDGESEQIKYLRLRTRMVGFYEPPAKFGATESHELLVGLGIETFKMPTLDVTDEDTGVAELTTKNVVGPYIGIQYLKQTSDEHFFGAEFGFVPIVFGNVRKGMSANGFTYWRFSFAEEIFSELGVAIRQDSLNLDVTCSSSSLCREKGISTSQIFQGRMVIGYDF